MGNVNDTRLDIENAACEAMRKYKEQRDAVTPAIPLRGSLVEPKKPERVWPEYEEPTAK